MVPERPSITDLLARLGAQARALIRAETRLYRAEAGRRLVSAGWGAALCLVALALLQGVTVALLVGIVLALTPLWGAGLATAAVTTVGVALAALCGWLGLRWIGDALDNGTAGE